MLSQFTKIPEENLEAAELVRNNRKSLVAAFTDIDVAASSQ